MLKSLQVFAVYIFVSPLFILAACTSKPVSGPKTNTNISIMAYNLENLFDTEHDEGKNDFAFLPKKMKEEDMDIEKLCEKASDTDYRKDECINSDWNDQKLEVKFKRLADTILSVNGNGPDILIVEEVENIKVLQQLNQKYLAKAGYQTVVLIEGEDERGIDVGLMSRLPLAGKPVLNSIEFQPTTVNQKGERPKTRGILEVPLKLPNGETLTAMGLHFPSQGAPVEQRKDAVIYLNKLLAAKGPNALVVAGGDCNISSKEEKMYHLQRDLMGSQWAVSNYVGCKDCLGTEVYRDVWSFFDILLFSPALTNGKGSYQLKPQTIRTPKEGKYQVEMSGYPARFNAKKSVGVSDHFPIYGEISPK